ncbi:NAD(P)H-binding protein [Pseudonocardia sp.]|jgi:uncharacterized protein YbjT (DUF2867 family)|uniref:NAD(P)H-binding protein n=1 Tax=Pseudonocardia sp. TaxID=60912 RepID=UPI0031FC6B47
MYLVTGATGSVGRTAVDLLLAEGYKVVAVTRDPSRSELPGEAQVVAGDPSKPETLALNGVEAILLAPRTVRFATAELLSLAAAHGVGRVVVLSAATVEYPVGLPRFREHFRSVEADAKASGLEWTFLRSTDYAANTMAWAPQVRAGNVVRGAYGGAATSTVHERDVAAAAVRALVDPGHAGRSYVLTGSESLSQYDKVRLLGEAIGKDLTFVELPPEQVHEAMLAQGLPADVPERLLGSLADYAVQAGPTSHDVEKVLGRSALTFAQWAAEHAGAFRD